MARLAFITSLLPTSRPDTGFEIANRAVLRGLVMTGHHVTAFGFARPEDVVDPQFDQVVLGRFEIENHRVGAATRARWLAGAMALGLPVTCAKLRLAGGGNLAARIASHGPFDAVVLNSVTMPGAFPALFEIAPCLLVEHNVEHVSARQNAQTMTRPLLRWLYGREASLLERIELDAVDRARFVWFLAEEDRAAFGPSIRERSSVLPLVLDRQTETSPSADAPTATHDIGLIGTWTWAPNRIGLDWFVREVLPLLPPDLGIAVAGRIGDPLPDMTGRIRWLGRVPDAAAFLAQCRTTALVSRAGTGVQLKSLEMLELGLPAVATPQSLRGIALRPDNVRLADSAPDFAQALIQLVEEVRAGHSGRLDGTAFAVAQRLAHEASLRQGLEIVTDPSRR